MTKACPKCGEVKSLSDFHQGRKRKDGSRAPRSRCKVCHAEDQREYLATPEGKKIRLGSAKIRYYKHREKNLKKRRDNHDPIKSSEKHLLARYGITREGREAMLAAQGGQCAVCQSSTPRGNRKQWVIDHDHSCCPGDKTCGKCIRGVICAMCNLAVGNFEDDPDRCLNAATYLMSFKPVLELQNVQG